MSAQQAPLPGCLISFEGGEAAGKTTQMGLLASWLRDAGLAVTTLREPGGTPTAERLRAIVLDPALEPLLAETEVLLFAAARGQAVGQAVRPALARGEVVLCDRYLDSSLAYQGYGLGVDLGFIRLVNDRVTGGLCPDLTLLLDVPPEAAQGRRPPSADRIERRPATFHAAVRRGYLALAAAEPERFRLLDGARATAEVHGDVLAAALTVLARKGYAVPHPPEGRWAAR